MHRTQTRQHVRGEREDSARAPSGRPVQVRSSSAGRTATGSAGGLPLPPRRTRLGWRKRIVIEKGDG